MTPGTPDVARKANLPLMCRVRPDLNARSAFVVGCSVIFTVPPGTVRFPLANGTVACTQRPLCLTMPALHLARASAAVGCRPDPSESTKPTSELRNTKFQLSAPGPAVEIVNVTAPVFELIDTAFATVSVAAAGPWGVAAGSVGTASASLVALPAGAC